MTSCAFKEEKKLKISITNWTGYSPFLYLKEKKILDKLNIKLLLVSSLSENLYLYSAQNSDAFVGTQYEYKIAKQDNPTLVPLKLLDRSNGGDMILSTHNINKLKKSNKIDAYLELDSINSILLEDFIKSFDINSKKINYKNKDQVTISNLKKKKLKNPSLAVTYSPYDKKLINNGFNELLNTKTSSHILVIDALFTTKEIFNDHKSKFNLLNDELNLAIEFLKKNPKAYFETIKMHYPNTSYEEFAGLCEKITWTNKHLEKKYSDILKKHNFPLRDILK